MLLLSRRAASALSLGTLFVLASCSGGGGSSPSTALPQSNPVVNGGARAMSVGKTIQRPFSDFKTSQPGFWTATNPANQGYYYFFLATSSGASSNLPNCTGTAGNYAAGYMDYLGYENDKIVADGHPSVGTKVTGTVTQSDNGDGTSTVRVDFTTTNAIATGACFNFNVFPSVATDEPLDFGYTLSEIESGATPALGTSQFSFVFTIQGTGAAAPLPNLAFVPNCPGPAPCLQTVKFSGNASGALRAPYGVADGTPGTLSMSQIGTNHTTGIAGRRGFPDMGLTAATVTILPAKK